MRGRVDQSAGDTRNGIGKSTLRPVLFNDDVISVRDEIRVPFSAPRSSGERLQLLYLPLTGVRMIPTFVIPGSHRR